MDCSMPGFPVLHYLLKFAKIHVHWVSARRSNQSILKEIHPGCSLEGLMLKLKLRYFGYLMWRADSFERSWCWERLKAGGEGDNRGWDGWMTSPTQWTWVWVNSGSWWWTGRSGVLRFMGSQRVRHNWETELNWIESVMLSNHLILYQPFLLLLSIFPSFRVFSNESAPHIRGPKYWICSTCNPIANFRILCVILLQILKNWNLSDGTLTYQLFHSPLSPSLRSSLVPLHFLPLEWCHLHVWGCWYFSRQSWFQLVIHPSHAWKIHPCISHDVLCIEVKQAGWQYLYSFPYFELVLCSMSDSNCCFLTCIQVSQEAVR